MIWVRLVSFSLARLLFGHGGAGSGHFLRFLREILPKTSILARILIAQSVERKALNLVVVGSSPMVVLKSDAFSGAPVSRTPAET